MIQVIPSLSIARGKLAKIGKGTYEEALLFEKSPLDLAIEFEQAGFKHLHVVDIDGARAENVVNYQTLQILSAYTKLEINFSGGIRTDGGVALAFENGAKRVTAATMAADHPEVFAEWLISFGRNKLVLGVDVDADGRVVSRGWKTNTGIFWPDMVAFFRDRGVQYVKLTDISRDGVYVGPNFNLYTQFKIQFPELKLMTSGGVRGVEDVNRLNDLGVDNVIIARAFYEGKINLEELSRFA